MLKGGVIMDVTTPEQAKIAEAAGACAVMALERIPADILAAGGVSRMSDPKMIRGIQDAVSIPVMAKCRIGHLVAAQVLAEADGNLVAARQGNQLVTAFHPELSDDLRVHRFFLELIEDWKRKEARQTFSAETA